MSALPQVILFALALAAAVLVLVFVLVPLLKVLGVVISAVFRGIGWLIMHVFEFVAGMIGDVLRFVGSVIAMLLLAPFALLNLVIGRWSAAGHFADSVRREGRVASACLYRVALRRPLRLLLLDSMLEGVEQRVPEAMAAAPTSDTPRRRVGQFDGYTILGSLRGGGSGAKLYVAAPDNKLRGKYPGMPDRVVIKSFALSEGSSLPQIVRESRALECAKQLGLVFEHGMDARRFYYVMPYHAGDHLGIVVRQLHGETDGDGLGRRQLATALGYAGDLVSTLSTYHRGGLWHKDVKPENIIINEGRAHLVDLGLVTPLRSAMTLTTHGTEYFRDPELVRQALRGVKVHQIDGAKFDVYAAGAVLYFIIENTFPAHGALSRFTKRSPDALRWIIRRAMADYSHRYATTDELFADLRHLAAAGDFAAVKPADLPSMRGHLAGGPADDVAVDHVDEPAVASGAQFHTPVPPPAPASAPGTPRRPRLKVTNWWTGEYRMADDAADAGKSPFVAVAAIGIGKGGADVRREATALRHDVADLRHKVRTGAMSARRAAREQVRLARTRAKEIRRQTRVDHKGRGRRHRAVAERQPSWTLGLIGAVAMLGVVALVAAALSRGGHSRTVTIFGHEDAQAVAPADHEGTPLLLIDDSENPSSKRSRRQRERIVKQYRDKGYAVIEDDVISEGVLGSLLAQWQRKRGDDGVHDVIDTHLEEELARHNLYGLLHVTGGKRLHGSLVWSEHENADQRRWGVAVAGPPAPTLPYLLVNDHPAGFDPEVAARVDALVAQYRAGGFEIIVDDEREAAVRMALPAGRVDEDEAMPEMLPVALARTGLGGILYVTAAAGDGPARERILIRTIDADPAIVVEVETPEPTIPPTPPMPPEAAVIEGVAPAADAPLEGEETVERSGDDVVEGGVSVEALPVAVGG